MTEHSDFLKGTGIDAIYLVVDRNDVEQSSLGNSLRALHALTQNQQTVLKFQGRLNIAMSGYDGDVRELYEIQEVRNFWLLLDRAFPFWFYFIDLQSKTLNLITLCLCRHKVGLDGRIVLDASDFEDFVVKHFAALSWLFREYRLDDKQGEMLTAQLVKYFENTQRQNLIH